MCADHDVTLKPLGAEEHTKPGVAFGGIECNPVSHGYSTGETLCEACDSSRDL